MKPNQDQLEDQLLDALLHEQSRSDREDALRKIEDALDTGPAPISLPIRSPWPRRLATIAACGVVGGLLAFGVGEIQKSRRISQQVAQTSALAASAKARVKERADLDKAIRDQEAKVEQNRKALATIVRTKGIIYQGQDSFYGQSGVKKDTVADANEETIRKNVADSAGAEFPEVASEVNNNGGSFRGSGAGHGTGTGLGGGSGIGSGKGLTAPLAAPPTRGMITDSRDVARVESESRRDFRPHGNHFENGSVPGEEAAQERPNTERYGSLVDPVWQRPTEYPLSTFSIDVDNASYSNIRRMIRDGQSIPADAVRIEECVNAFDYNYAKPTGDNAFAVHTTLATCPWNEQHLLMKVGIKGREISAQQRPVSNLVFLIDVSGSMQDANKLPLVKESIKLLLHQLDERDSVSYVVYAGSEGVVLPPTKMTESGRTRALDALAKLEAGGSTNGGSGIKRAYQIAKENFIKDGVNRVILATDGDFNVGVTDSKQLVELVKKRAKDNIYLSVLAFGTGNLNDEMLESISKDGNGIHYYIDSIREGRKVFLQRLSGTLITIAKDVKIQVEFNPGKVGSYRLIGYANRVLKDEDFNNDKVDAGDIGAGHTVTAFYEIVPTDMPQPNARGTDPLKYQKPAENSQPAAESKEPSDEWLTLKLRHKSPEGEISSLQETIVKGPAVRWQESDGDFSFASAVALFGMKLRGMDEARNFDWTKIRELATPGLKDDHNENRAEFIGLLNALQKRGE
ncbi:MAG: VWA domain-containing protein [Luteolibacter sp.]